MIGARPMSGRAGSGAKMKVLNPTISIVMASHMKPEYLPSAIESVLRQTRQDFQLIVIDSGEWIPRHEHQLHPLGPRTMRQIHGDYSSHPLVEWYSLGEPSRLINRKCPYAYVWNCALRHLVRGKYVCFFTDDDLYKPNYLELMAGHLDRSSGRESLAVFCAQERVRLHTDGTQTDDGILAADTTRSTFDNHVDMLQMMVRTDLLWQMRETGTMEAMLTGPLPVPAYQWFNEDPANASCRHADGQFMDRVGQIVGEVSNISDILVTHRFTPVSTYN